MKLKSAIKITALSALIFAIMIFCGCDNANSPSTSGSREETTELAESSITSSVQTTPETSEEKTVVVAEKQPNQIVSPDSETAIAVFVNQVGYLPNSIKRAVVTGGGRDFYIVRANTGEVAYSGQVEKGSPRVYEYSGDVVCYADFSDFKEDGTYYVYVPNGNIFSYTFTIGDKVLDEISAATLKGFYYQRCGVALDESLVIEGAAHPACHLKEIPYYENQSEKRSVTGGWHDAGDNGIYTCAMAYTVELLLSQYMMMPELYGDSNAIPESGNGVPDILDECLVALNWLLQMQDSDGGVYLQISGTHHAPAGLLPHQDTNQHYIWPKRLESTCGFVASMALASTVYADISPDASEIFKNAALKGGEWIKANWDQEKMVWPDGFAAGRYDGGTSLDEERFNAAVAMTLLTGEEYWKEQLDTYFFKMPNFTGRNHNDGTFMSLWLYLTMPSEYRDSEHVDLFEAQLKTAARKMYRIYEENPWNIAVSGDQYGWGSNHELCAQLIIMICADQYFATDTYKDAVVESVDYILGKNPVGYCFVTGFGTNPVVNMHHRMSHDEAGNKYTLPGYMVSGPVKYPHAVISHKNLGDFGLSEDTPNMKCFYDDFSLYRFTESDLFRLALSSWVLHSVKNVVE